jgi:hypothetical protein
MFKSTLATADPVTLSPPHAPKEASIAAFEQVLPALKHELVKLRHEHNSTPLLPSSPLFLPPPTN